MKRWLILFLCESYLIPDLFSNFEHLCALIIQMNHFQSMIFSWQTTCIVLFYISFITRLLLSSLLIIYALINNLHPGKLYEALAHIVGFDKSSSNPRRILTVRRRGTFGTLRRNTSYQSCPSRASRRYSSACRTMTTTPSSTWSMPSSTISRSVFFLSSISSLTFYIPRTTSLSMRRRRWTRALSRSSTRRSGGALRNTSSSTSSPRRTSPSPRDSSSRWAQQCLTSTNY